MFLTKSPILIAFALSYFLCVGSACTPPHLGRPFSQNPLREIKVGFDQKKDVSRKLGQPYRTHTDEKGNSFFVYLWSDGMNRGRKCVVMFNPQGLVSIVNVVQ